jgi:hypothetical protein
MNKSSKDNVTITNKADRLIFYYSYYADFIAFPEGGAKLPGLTGKETTRADYWLPEVLQQNLAEYSLRPKPERIGNDVCYVLERKGRDVLWFDASKRCALRRRDCLDPASGSLRERTLCDNFERVFDTWLPRLVVREEYGGLERPKEFFGKLCARKRITVHSFETAAIPASEFLIPIRDGYLINDQVRGLIYKKTPEGDRPLETSAVEAKRVLESSFSSWFNMWTIIKLLFSFVIILLGLAAFLMIYEKTRRPI